MCNFSASGLGRSILVTRVQRRKLHVRVALAEFGIRGEQDAGDFCLADERPDLGPIQALAPMVRNWRTRCPVSSWRWYPLPTSDSLATRREP